MVEYWGQAWLGFGFPPEMIALAIRYTTPTDATPVRGCSVVGPVANSTWTY
jgi:hypothetical protein